MGWRQHHGWGAAIRVHPATLTFMTTKWDLEQPVTFTVAEEGDLIGAAITLAHTTTGGGHVDVGSTMTLTVMAAHSSEETKSWHLRVGRTVSHQVVDAPEERWSAPNAAGFNSPWRGRPSQRHPAGGTRKGCSPRPWALRPSPPKHWWRAPPSGWCQGQREERPPDFWGQQSWGRGSCEGDNNGADGEISSTTTPQLGLWAIASYGWGNSPSTPVRRMRPSPTPPWAWLPSDWTGAPGWGQ